MKKKVICLLLVLTALIGCLNAIAEDEQVFIFCNPKTPVNVRRTPKKGAEVSGLLDFGDSVMTDWKKKNGFLHVYGVTEDGEGWIFAGYVITDQPVKVEKTWANIAASGRVKAYRWIKGRKNCWVQVGDQVKVLALSEEWAVTNKGYIRTKYLEVWHE